MEEVKQSRVHLEIAQRIVDKLAGEESNINQEKAQVLKTLLKGQVAPDILKENKIPSNWFIDDMTPKDKLLIELSAYLKQIEFIESKKFNEKLE
jgi:hypothetical protein